MLCSTGSPSSWPRVVWKKLSSASRWQSALPLISASLAPSVGVAHRARRADRLRQVGPLQVLADAFERAEEERPCPCTIGPPTVPPNCSRWKSVSGLPSDVFDVSPSRRWKWNSAAVQLVGARLGDDVDHAAGGAAELGVGAGGDHLELLDRFERDVDRGALAAHLLAEEAVVVVAAVEADVVEDAALPGEGDFVAVRSLHDADAGRERQQVLELASEDRRSLRSSSRRACSRGGRRLVRPSAMRVVTVTVSATPDTFIVGLSRTRLADGDQDVLLHQRGEAGSLNVTRVAARRQLQRHESAGPIRDAPHDEVRVDVADLDVDAGQHAAAGVEHDSTNVRRGDLSLRACG